MGWPYNTVHNPMYANSQQLTVATVSATSTSAFPAATVILRISANTGIWYNTAGSASALAGNFLPANTVEYVACGGSSIINVLAVTTSGTAWLTPCSS